MSLEPRACGAFFRAQLATPAERDYICMMTQVRMRRRPGSPKQAAACCAPIDEALAPELFRALGDPTRISLLACIAKCGRPCSVGEVAECCSVDFSVVSRHLSLLARAGVLDATKSGRTVAYSVRFAHLAEVFRSLAAAIEQCRPTRKELSGGCC